MWARGWHTAGMRNRPPSIDGLAASTLQLPPGAWSTVLDCLCERFPSVTRLQWEERMARGRVVDGDSRQLTPETPFRVGLEVHYYREVPDEAPIPFDEVVLHADDHLLVADKPHFLAVMPAGAHVHETLLGRLIRRTGTMRWCRCTGSIATPPDWCCSLPTRRVARSTRRCFANDGSKKPTRPSPRRCRIWNFPTPIAVG